MKGAFEEKQKKVQKNANITIRKLPPHSFQNRDLLVVREATYSENTSSGESVLIKQLFITSKKEVNIVQQNNVPQQSKLYVVSHCSHAVRWYLLLVLNEKALREILWGTKTIMLYEQQVFFPDVFRN